MELKAPQAGQPITASFLRALVEAVGKRIIGGDGIIVDKTYQGIVIKGGGKAGALPTSGASIWQEYTGDDE